jgi:hypothetical protein
MRQAQPRPREARALSGGDRAGRESLFRNPQFEILHPEKAGYLISIPQSETKISDHK